MRRQVVAAACKKNSVSLSLFMEVNNLAVDEELSTMARAEGVSMGRWRRERAAEGMEEGRSSKYRLSEK